MYSKIILLLGYLLFTKLVVGLTYVGDHEVLGKNVHRTNDGLFISDLIDNNLFSSSNTQPRCDELGHGARLMSKTEADKLYLEINRDKNIANQNKFSLTKSFWIESGYELYLDDDEKPIRKPGINEKLYLRCVLREEPAENIGAPPALFIDAASDEPNATPKEFRELESTTRNNTHEEGHSSASTSPNSKDAFALVPAHNGWWESSYSYVTWKNIALFIAAVAIPVCWKAYCWYMAPTDQKAAEGAKLALEVGKEKAAQAGTKAAEVAKHLIVRHVYNAEAKKWLFEFTNSITNERIYVFAKDITKSGRQALINLANNAGGLISIITKNGNGLSRLLINGISVHFKHYMPLAKVLGAWSKLGN